MCVYLSHKDNFDAGTKALAFYAREYKKDPDNNKHGLAMFRHLWRLYEDLWIFGGVTRSAAVSNVLDGKNITDEDCIDMYAGEYGKKEMGMLDALDTKLAKAMKKAAIKVNSCKLKTFLVEKNLLAAKMMLLSTDLPFNTTWSGYQKGDYPKYEFGCDKRNILKCACDSGDLDIISSVGNRYTQGIILAMLENYSIDLLEKFIVKNYDLSFKERFGIWGQACCESGSGFGRTRAVQNPELDGKIFEMIMTLLFSGEVDSRNESGASLLYFAVASESEPAIDYLIERNVNLDVLDPNGFTSLFSAYEKPEIVAKLLAAKADVNARTSLGRTALMAAAINRRCYRFTIEVIDLLLAAGGDVNAVDNDGCSVLHHYANYSERCWELRCSDVVRKLIKNGADVDLVDNLEKTAYDYAQENGNLDLMRILQKHNGEK